LVQRVVATSLEPNEGAYTKFGDQHLIGLDDKKFDRRLGDLEPTIIDLPLVLARNKLDHSLELTRRDKASKHRRAIKLGTFLPGR
jgi:hypothetical protein